MATVLNVSELLGDPATRRRSREADELPGQVGLVGVAQVGRERSPVDRLAAVGAFGRLVQPGPAHHPLGADPHVVREEPLQRTRGQPRRRGQLVDPAQPREEATKWQRVWKELFLK